MLKKSASVVLGSSKSSTYPRGYASGFDSPAALLDGLFEHPEVGLTATPLPTRRMTERRRGGGRTYARGFWQFEESLQAHKVSVQPTSPSGAAVLLRMEQRRNR